jgi:PP-loop superfamily ATP-utilizing enzyme
MNNEEQVKLIREQLDCMIGLRYKYGGTEHIVKSFNISEEKERVSVQTNKKVYDRPFDSIMEFLNKFEPIPETGMEVYENRDSVPIPKMQINSQVISQLKDMLMENIQNVKKDKNYIPQATAVKLNVDSIIDLAKIEVSYMEAYVRINKVK